jgi:hypothetical protein
MFKKDEKDCELLMFYLTLKICFTWLLLCYEIEYFKNRTLKKIVLWNCRVGVLHSINWFSFKQKSIVSDDSNGFVVIVLYNVSCNISGVTYVKYYLFLTQLIASFWVIKEVCMLILSYHSLQHTEINNFILHLYA